MFVEIIMFCIAITLLLCYWNVNQIYTIWLKCNIPFEKGQFPYGNIKDVGKTMNIYEFTTNLYKRLKNESPLAGFHVLTNAAVVITDLNIVKQILVTDSNLFLDRGLYVNLRDDPLSGSIFNLDGPKHMALRSQLMTTFSTEKIKSMLSSTERIADRLNNYLSDYLKGKALDLNLQDALVRYTTDVMGTVFLGINCNSFKDESVELRSICKNFLGKGRERGLTYFFRNTFQETARRLKIIETPKVVSDFFIRTVKATMDNREKTEIVQNDFIDLLIKLKNTDEVNESSEEKLGCLTVEEAVSQAYMFYAAGFETTTTTLSLCLYEITKNREIQEILRKHIIEVLEHNSDKPQYDMLNKLTYLDQVINETLRKHPPVPIVFRTATYDYKLPNTNMVIPTGTQIMVPIYAINHDEKIYAKPEIYNPDRFAEDNVAERHPCSFIPFGSGPRACIGMQFAMMHMKLTLVSLLKKYRFSVGSKTPFPLKFDKKSATLNGDDIWLTVENL